MKRITVLLIVVWASVAVFAAGEWKAELEMIRESWLPGEPVTANLRVTNISGREAVFYSGTVHLDGAEKPCVDRSAGVVDTPAPPEPGEVDPDAPLAGDPAGAVREIELRISRICNLETGMLDELYGPHRVCYRQSSPTGEACAKFEIVRPIGEDAEVVKLFPPRLRDVLTDSSYVPSDLLDTYPTSRYAGYVLTRELLDLQDWRVKAADPECFVRSVKKRGFRPTYSDKQEALFESIETHVDGGNVAPQLAPRLWEYYGEQLLSRGRVEEARDAFATAAAASGSGTDFYRKRAARFFEVLAEEKADE